MEKRLNMSVNSAISNVSVIRVAVATFISEIEGITIDDIMDVKTSISEAVTNAIEHGYEKDEGIVEVSCSINGKDITAVIRDYGSGIEDISLAITPAYTSKPELEHAGLGFTIMESFMDELQIDSQSGSGTTITLKKKIINKKNTGN